MIFFFFDYIDLSFDNSHNELQLDELPSNDDDKLRDGSHMKKRNLEMMLVSVQAAVL